MAFPFFSSRFLQLSCLSVFIFQPKPVIIAFVTATIIQICPGKLSPYITFFNDHSYDFSRTVNNCSEKVLARFPPNITRPRSAFQHLFYFYLFFFALPHPRKKNQTFFSFTVQFTLSFLTKADIVANLYHNTALSQPPEHVFGISNVFFYILHQLNWLSTFSNLIIIFTYHY